MPYEDLPNLNAKAFLGSAAFVPSLTDHVTLESPFKLYQREDVIGGYYHPLSDLSFVFIKGQDMIGEENIFAIMLSEIHETNHRILLTWGSSFLMFPLVYPYLKKNIKYRNRLAYLLRRLLMLARNITSERAFPLLEGYALYSAQKQTPEFKHSLRAWWYYLSHLRFSEEKIKVLYESFPPESLENKSSFNRFVRHSVEEIMEKIKLKRKDYWSSYQTICKLDEKYGSGNTLTIVYLALLVDVLKFLYNRYDNQYLPFTRYPYYNDEKAFPRGAKEDFNLRALIALASEADEVVFSSSELLQCLLELADPPRCFCPKPNIFCIQELVSFVAKNIGLHEELKRCITFSWLKGRPFAPQVEDNVFMIGNDIYRTCLKARGDYYVTWSYIRGTVEDPPLLIHRKISQLGNVNMFLKTWKSPPSLEGHSLWEIQDELGMDISRGMGDTASICISKEGLYKW